MARNAGVKGKPVQRQRQKVKGPCKRDGKVKTPVPVSNIGKNLKLQSAAFRDLDSHATLTPWADFSVSHIGSSITGLRNRIPRLTLARIFYRTPRPSVDEPHVQPLVVFCIIIAMLQSRLT